MLFFGRESNDIQVCELVKRDFRDARRDGVLLRLNWFRQGRITRYIRWAKTFVDLFTVNLLSTIYLVVGINRQQNYSKKHTRPESVKSLVT